ncbi:MAG: nucleotide sugar dehydrogenase, partial [Alphaproteobacteria bacterium]|nr:nucleotide sugar dehydrogenase [Alphaproteobacteria bacterium]
NPEFLREGNAIEDFMNPDRIVIGTRHAKAQETLASLYKPFTEKGFTLFATDIASSEMIKYAANAFLAVKISFINQIADLCEKVGAHVGDVANGLGADHRIGSAFLNPGPGYGGSCFPKDTKALIHTASKHGQDLSIVRAAATSNEERKHHLANRLIQAIDAQGKEKTFKLAILGITFKARTDDMRDASSLVIIPELLKNGIQLTVFDPIYHQGSGREHTLPEFKGVTWAQSIQDALQGADGLCILTEWDEFKNLDLNQVRQFMAPNPLFADFRNLYQYQDTQGFYYMSLGQKDRPLTLDQKVRHA